MESILNLNLFPMIILFCCPLILVVVGSFIGCSSLIKYAKDYQTKTNNKKDEIKGILFIILAIYNVTAYFIMIPCIIMYLSGHTPTDFSFILIQIFWLPVPLELLTVDIYGIINFKNNYKKWSKRKRALCIISIILSYLLVMWSIYILFRLITWQFRF